MAERPWKATPELEGLYDIMAEYVAWERWLNERLQAAGCGHVLDRLDAEEEEALYAVMCELADGANQRSKGEST